MQYREIKKLGTKISTYGMGCMRLPLISDAGTHASHIDEQQAIDMIHYSIDNGVNYIDTAYVYHGSQSEVILGKALNQDGYRNKTLIATKFPSYMMVFKRYEELKADPIRVVEQIIDEELQRLMTDHIDVYLLHNLSTKRWPPLKDINIIEILERMKEKGKIRFIGFSFHDDHETFKSIIDSYDWDMCQIQLNILDQEYQAGIAGLKYAGSKGIPVAVMEPLRGGSLATNVPEEVMNTWNSYGLDRSHIDWCFRWICNFPEVMTVLSGVSNMEQARYNVHLFDNMLPNSMSIEELELVQKVRELYMNRTKVSCTNCGYCMPCPSGVNIPGIFKTYNNSSIFNNIEKGRSDYASYLSKRADASQCIECRRCEEQCPHNVHIVEKLHEANTSLR